MGRLVLVALLLLSLSLMGAAMWSFFRVLGGCDGCFRGGVYSIGGGIYLGKFMSRDDKFTAIKP